LARGCDDARRREIEGIDRRRFMGTAALAAGAVAVAAAPGDAHAFDKKKKKERPPRKQPPQPGDRLIITSAGAQEGQLVYPKLLELGAAPLTAFPLSPDGEVVRRGSRLNRLLVLRLDAGDMSEDTRALAADGVVAYSAVCTHKACTIKSWRAERQHLRCHCHLSEFAPLNTGKVMAGPAKSPLPLLGLKLDADGVVEVAASFNRKPGARTK